MTFILVANGDAKEAEISFICSPIVNTLGLPYEEKNWKLSPRKGVFYNVIGAATCDEKTFENINRINMEFIGVLS